MKPGDRVTDGQGSHGTVIRATPVFVFVDWDVPPPPVWMQEVTPRGTSRKPEAGS